MCSNRPDRFILAILAWMALLGAGNAAAAEREIPTEGSYRVALVTYGPGEVYWQRFGHNAIWLWEPEVDLDHTFNFGFFDFEQENFLLRFVQGRMLYFAAAVPAEREMDHYRSDDRSVRVQELRLDPGQYARLRDHLLNHIQPENRNYLYDYYLDNCSTRLRDALDLALEGALSEQFQPQPGLQTFRGHTRRSTAADFWYYLGLEAGLGTPVDRPISRWDEMFLPAMLADNLNEITMLSPRGLQTLVTKDTPAFESSREPPPQTAPMTWPRYLALALGVLLAAWLAARLAPPVLVEGFMQGWLLIAGTLGLLMLALWAWTDHHAANPNANLLLLNPVMLLGLAPRWRRLTAGFMVLVGLAAAVMWFLPWIQYTRDVTALLLPLNLAAAYRLWACDPPPGGKGSGWRRLGA